MKKEDGNFRNGYSDFELIAHAKLNLSDANARIKTYDLVMESIEKSNQLPLFGHFCCRLAVQPKCMIEETFSGYLSLVQIPTKLCMTLRGTQYSKTFPPPDCITALICSFSLCIACKVLLVDDWRMPVLKYTPIAMPY
ncbi:rhotekin-2 [Trichonephila clavipes]|nr:rhotekin-2 [Trichonephila clavipes]